MDELIGLVADVDSILQVQSKADVAYFEKASGASLHPEEVEVLRSGVLNAYRRQYIFSGVEHPRYQSAITALINDAQAQRIEDAPAPLR